MAIPLSELVTAIEARITAQVSGARVLKRLEPPSENPQQLAHKGVRAWPESTDVEEAYGTTDVNWYRDSINVELVYRVGRDVVTSRTAALDFEEDCIQALTDRTWYASTGTWSVTDAVELQVGGRTRSVEDGWIVTTVNVSVLRQESL